jgi:hypothetical protein
MVEKQDLMVEVLVLLIKVVEEELVVEWLQVVQALQVYFQVELADLV